MTTKSLTERLDADPDGDLFDIFLDWTLDLGIELYPAQEEAILEIFDGNHVVLNTPTGSGKSLVALAMHFFSFAHDQRSYYTSPIKALVSEKFFALCESFGAEHVGMLTGDATINPDAPIICCTQEILAAAALSEGEDAEIHHAIIDEFHYYTDRERGTAWQLPLLTLTQTTFLLMSATLGDTSHMRERLEERTGRTVSLVKSTTRPVPLEYTYSKEKLVHLAHKLVLQGKSPVYIVHFTQRECAETAQALMSVNYCSDEEKAAIKAALKGSTFDTPYGKTVKRYLLHGVAIHHGGLIPKYRFLAEKLSQQGLLKLVVGTDTLGVGINMPLRTVVFSKLCKYDGEKTRLLTVRDFKQIAGRAGRKGFDDQGYVISQAPEHVIENEAAVAKVKDNPKKLKRLKLKSAPDRGYVHWDEETFNHLYTSDSEALESRFRITHSTLLYLLQRPVGPDRGFDDLLDLIDRSHETPARKDKLVEKAHMLLASLRDANIVDYDDGPEGPENVDLVEGLQRDFSVHHSLSLYLVEVVDNLDPEDPQFVLLVLTLVESILEDPGVVLRRLRDKERDKEYHRLKADGVEYDELKEKLEKVTYPMPDAELVRAAYTAFAERHPWVTGFEPSPKAVARDMFERHASFNQYVKEYGLERSEGVLLRYLNQAYKTLRQNVPETARTPAVHDAIAYLREVIARADSSLVEEWEMMLTGERPEAANSTTEDEKPALDDDPVAFRARVHAELMQLLAALAQQDFDEASALLRERPDEVDPIDLERVMEPFFEEYGRVVFNHAARSKSLVRFERHGPGSWQVTQVICDPEEDNMWYLRGSIDLSQIDSDASRLIALDYIGE